MIQKLRLIGISSLALLRLAAVSPPPKKSERRSGHSRGFTIDSARPPAGLAGTNFVLPAYFFAASRFASQSVFWGG